MASNLQFLIYAADVAKSVNGFTLLASMGTTIGAIVAIVKGNSGRGAAAEAWDVQSRYAHNKSERPVVPPFSMKYGKGLIIATAALIGVNVIVPSSGTLYAIAATEVAEVVVHSETAEKAVNAFNRFLDAQFPEGAANATNKPADSQ